MLKKNLKENIEKIMEMYLKDNFNEYTLINKKRIK